MVYISLQVLFLSSYIKDMHLQFQNKDELMDPQVFVLFFKTKQQQQPPAGIIFLVLPQRGYRPGRIFLLEEHLRWPSRIIAQTYSL